MLQAIQAIIDALSENVAITDEGGEIIAVNRGWRQFADRNDLSSPEYALRENYLRVLDTSEVSVSVRRGFEQVASGRRAVFELEYPCHSPREKRWFLLTITRFPHDDTFLLLVSHKDITFIKSHEHAVLNVLFQTIDAIGSTIEKKDPYTSGHQRRVALLAAQIAREIGLPQREVNGVWFGALIHDVGKIYVPAEVLNRPGRLTRVEFEFIKEHTEVGYDIVRHIDFPWPVADIVRQHHERLDGSGYPLALRGDDISFAARVVAVADVFEAMSNHRPYRPALGKDRAMAELQRGRDLVYDAAAVDGCLTVVGAIEFDFEKLAPPFDLL